MQLSDLQLEEHSSPLMVPVPGSKGGTISGRQNLHSTVNGWHQPVMLIKINIVLYYLEFVDGQSEQLCGAHFSVHWCMWGA